LAIEFLYHLLPQELLLILLQHIAEELSRGQDSGGIIGVIPEPHFRVKLVILDVKVFSCSLAELRSQGMFPLLAPGVIVASSTELEDFGSHDGKKCSNGGHSKAAASVWRTRCRKI